MDKNTRFASSEDYIRKSLQCITDNIKATDIEMFNPGLLAYMGDAVYEVFVRSFLISRGYCKSGKLHKKAIKFVQAEAQSKLLEGIYENLTEEEVDVFKRGRNAKTTSMPKNAQIADYKQATGFEALIGYLYLNGCIDRLFEILNRITDIMKDKL